ncbi:SH3 domain-containing protein [Actibacterium sp. D379-3]
MFRMIVLLLAGIGLVLTIASEPRAPVQVASFNMRPAAQALSVPGSAAKITLAAATEEAPVAVAAPAPAARPRLEPTAKPILHHAPVTAEIAPVSFTQDNAAPMVHVTSSDAPRGYVPADASTPVATPDRPQATATVTGARVNLRAGPSTDDAVLGSLTGGTGVIVLNRTGTGWVELEVAATGLRGFMSARFITPAS